MESATARCDISCDFSDVANQKGKRPCPSFSGDHHPQQVVGSSSKNAHGERLSFGSVVNLLLLYICVAMRGALRVRRARTHHQYPSRPPVRLAPRRLLEGFADVVHRGACSMDDTSPFDAAAAAVVVASYHLLLLYTCDTCDIWRARSLLGRASCPSSSAKARGSRGVMLWVSRSLVGHDNTSTRRRSCRVSMGTGIGAFASPATTPPFFRFLSLSRLRPSRKIAHFACVNPTH